MSYEDRSSGRAFALAWLGVLLGIHGCSGGDAAPALTAPPVSAVSAPTTPDPSPASEPGASDAPLEECVEPPSQTPFGVVTLCATDGCGARYAISEMQGAGRFVAEEALDQAARDEAGAGRGSRPYFVVGRGEVSEQDLRLLAERIRASGLQATPCVPPPDWGMSDDGSVIRAVIARDLIRQGLLPRGSLAAPGASADVTLGALTREEIRTVIRANVEQVRQCYETQLASNPDLAGRVTTSFIIDPQGNVASAETAASTLGSVLAEDCIATAVRTWHFPAPHPSGYVLVRYPFVLESD